MSQTKLSEMEEWRSYPGDPRYKVSNLGRVMNKITIQQVTNGFMIKLEGQTYVYNSFDELVLFLRKEFGIKEVASEV